jgi:hypothetical protein
MLTDDQGKEIAALTLGGVSGEVMLDVCPFCDAATSRLYDLPDAAVRPHHHTRIACYFCFLRITGLRPKRRQLVS